MRATVEVLIRSLLALSVAFGFSAFVLCFSIIPDIAMGPVGFGKATPSGLITVLVDLSPVKWFAFAGAPFVFWSAFARFGSIAVDGAQIALAIITFLLGAAALVLRDLLLLHATYAVEPAVRGAVANGLYVLVLFALAWASISAKTRKGPL